MVRFANRQGNRSVVRHFVKPVRLEPPAKDQASRRLWDRAAVRPAGGARSLEDTYHRAMREAPPCAGSDYWLG
jgi:hypothetical protein